jgi:hypothetical protein
VSANQLEAFDSFDLERAELELVEGVVARPGLSSLEEATSAASTTAAVARAGCAGELDGGSEH